MNIDKRIDALSERLNYIKDIFGNLENANISMLGSELDEFRGLRGTISTKDSLSKLARLEDLFSFLESKLEKELTPMDRVRIVRHPQRICLTDILENVYDNYTELGGLGEFSIDPSMLIAQAYITRRVGQKVVHQPVMVIGQEKGHGQEFRNGGSAKPWGNAKALHYMKVAQAEGIPIHTYIFTPGSYPIEDYPGAAQQIAKNIYEMGKIDVPIISVISEGGSGGAEAIGLADRRLMLSHGYYSVISPEGAAAIEANLKGGKRVDNALIGNCARKLGITAEDNLEMGYIDRVVQEPHLGAKPASYDFFRTLRSEVIRATNEVCISVKGLKLFRAMALKQKGPEEGEDVFMRWALSSRARARLVEKRYEKFRNLSTSAYMDQRSLFLKMGAAVQGVAWSTKSLFVYNLVGRTVRAAKQGMEEIQAEAHLVKERTARLLKKNSAENGSSVKISSEVRDKLLCLSTSDQSPCFEEGRWKYSSPKCKDDRTFTCPNSASEGCLDLWAPDLFGDFAGVCSNCGHHFPMEYQWYLYNVFNYAEGFEFNSGIESANPLGYEGFDLKLDEARKKTGLRSSCITFETRMDGINAVVICLAAPFRGGSVGAAEGEKIIRAAERAQRKQLPLIFYAHGTAGIRIQEGTNGVLQMPRCTMALRKYVDAGGLYLVIYDTNSYGGSVASFLGCSPYQFGIRSSKIGFAGPRVITETTGIPVPPNYHNAWNALARGHIQGIWDRREMGRNIGQALMTMGGRNLYYR
ncbi:carboxyl transferase domain-containing protein [Maridesulfovibrio salexigens]|uniref:Acetyl-coenzyme A carboxylase carboxyl transferase subunits beta/alpha n=1 Tax=Maridesulfovibrio salexigens (strain ATCC 14822 / DSM 2638 / NCIMB 8403 / VKM B-1763) TaxID=526222 RepID=C6C022_MARSD|nr:carboxyl transferase domain-containing protein [Maridesulfovibrio salexigens]ACS80893.1 Acetyl-CoA carboxylase [Maridesulfovibrio salexigens DSM 2638]